MVGPSPGQNFVFCFGPDRTQAEIFSLSIRAREKFFYVYFGPGWARPRLQSLWAGPGPDKSVPDRPLAGVTLYNDLFSSLLMCEGLSNFGGGRTLGPHLWVRPCLHTLKKLVIELFKKYIGNDRIISCHFRTAWPSTSQDFNLCNFYLLDYLKNIVFCGPVGNLTVLKA